MLLASAGVGATIAALWLAHGGVARAAPTTILWGFLGFVAAVTGLTLSHPLSEGVIAMAALGACFEVCRTGALALLQVSVPDAMRGRIMSSLFLLTRLAGAIGVAAIGAAAADWGLKGPLLCGAALALLAWGGAYRVRDRTAAAFAPRRVLAVEGVTVRERGDERKTCLHPARGVGGALPLRHCLKDQGTSMARVTVEDCIDKIDNRFDLVLMASHRARAISSGAPMAVPRDNDKNPVVALREIGDGKLSPGDLREDVIHALQKHVEIDEPEAEAAPPMVNPNMQTQIELGADAQFDRMTEEDLLRGLEGLTPPPEPEDDGE